MCVFIQESKLIESYIYVYTKVGTRIYIPNNVSQVLQYIYCSVGSVDSPTWMLFVICAWRRSALSVMHPGAVLCSLAGALSLTA